MEADVSGVQALQRLEPDNLTSLLQVGGSCPVQYRHKGYHGSCRTAAHTCLQLRLTKLAHPPSQAQAGMMCLHPWAATGSSYHGEHTAACFLRMHQLAVQQNRGATQAMSGALALQVAAHPGLQPMSRGVREAATAAFEGADAALSRCRRLLPEPWLQRVAMAVGNAGPLLAAARALPQHPGGDSNSGGGGGGGGGGGSRAQPAPQPSHAAAVHRFSTCDCCGQRAVGLRRCSGCRHAQYCRHVRTLGCDCAASPCCVL